MIRTYIFIFGLIVLTSCGSKNEMPLDVLKTEKMQAVLWDMVKADAFTTEFIKKDSLKNATEENLKLQQQVFAIHKITRAEFYKSYDYYKAHTPLFKAILDSMIKQGNENNNRLAQPQQLLQAE